MPEEKAPEVTEEVEVPKEYVCKTCKWWMRCKPHAEAIELWGMEMFPFGECRAIPPSAIPGTKKMVAPNDPSGKVSVDVKLARFPHTYPTDWCGMWDEKNQVA